MTPLGVDLCVISSPSLLVKNSPSSDIVCVTDSVSVDVVDDLVNVNVSVELLVIVFVGIKVFPSISEPLKYACAFPFMLVKVGNTLPFSDVENEEVVPHITCPSWSVTGAAVMILTVL